jgi:DNA processing protein
MLAALPLADEELSAWLRLSLAPGLKPAALRALLAAFGLPQRVLQQPFAALAAVAGAQAAHAALAPAAATFAAELAALREWRAQPANAVLTLGDPAYPPRLLTMPDPPPLLYIRGRLDSLHARSVAIVGSRSATPQGVEDAQYFARVLSEAGIVVVSGLALGVDGAAHNGALGGAGGTVAVIGTGADRVYPASHQALAARIVEHGAIVSEWPLGTPARASNFPQRNRLIAGLVEGVLVVEAAMRSGSLITARLANDMGRDVFALPGSIHAPLSRGCHRLIQQGARLVETPEEILEELGIALPPPANVPRPLRQRPAASGPPITGGDDAAASTAPAAIDDDASLLLDALGYAPASLEILAERTDMPEAKLQATLLRLELAGHVSALPGGRFVRAAHR